MRSAPRQVYGYFDAYERGVVNVYLLPPDSRSLCDMQLARNLSSSNSSEASDVWRFGLCLHLRARRHISNRDVKA